MSKHLKLTGALRSEILRDLSRPHPFAAERVGFESARMGATSSGGCLLLINSYRPIPDREYVEDHSVGARIGSEAITWAMQAAYRGRQTHEGIFHVHVHCHHGETAMSWTDGTEIPRMISGFRSVSRHAAHGIIVLSLDHGTAWVWLPGQEEPTPAMSMAVIGAPLRVFTGGRKK